jgi:hypothetical protein
MSFWRRSKQTSVDDPDRQWLEEIAPRIRAAKEDRQRRLVGQQDRVASIERLLFDQDPIGINFAENTNEYRPEAETITLRLPEASTKAELLRIVHQEFVAWFGESTAGPMNRYERITSEIWALLDGGRSS